MKQKMVPKESTPLKGREGKKELGKRSLIAIDIYKPNKGLTDAIRTSEQALIRVSAS